LQPNCDIYKELMKKNLYTVVALLALAIGVSSCLGNSDDTEVTAYDDTAIGAFSLLAVNRYVHTTSTSGGDSVYLSKLTVSQYPFQIDQYQGKIYNTDSLPEDCDLKHVLVTATATGYSGTIVIKSATSDSLVYYSNADSIDFSTVREFRVYNNVASKYRAYQVQINKKQQPTSTAVVWKQMPKGSVMPTTPMAGWEFAYNETGNGIIASQDHWATRIDETLDEDSRLLPANGSFACWKLNNGLSYALLVGDCDAQDQYASVWRKVIDNTNPTSSSWVYVPVASNKKYGLPKGQHYFLLPYTNGSVLAIDGSGNIYQSHDQGITWLTSSALQSPVSSIAAASTDGNGGIWLLESGETGTIWYGE
jgi:hypothetical protein